MNAEEKDVLAKLLRKYVEARRIGKVVEWDVLLEFVKNYHWLAELPRNERKVVSDAVNGKEFDEAKRSWVSKALVPVCDAFNRVVDGLGYRLRNPFEDTVLTLTPVWGRFAATCADPTFSQPDWRLHPQRTAISRYFHDWVRARDIVPQDSKIRSSNGCVRLYSGFRASVFNAPFEADDDELVGSEILLMSPVDAAFVSIELCRILWLVNCGFGGLE